MKKITKTEIKNFLKGYMNTKEKMGKMADAKYAISPQNWTTKKELIEKMYFILKAE